MYSWIWIDIALLKALLTPSYWLILSFPRTIKSIESAEGYVTALTRKVAAFFSGGVQQDDQQLPTGQALCQRIRETTLRMQADIVDITAGIVTTASFGFLVPPLLLIAPLGMWLQLRSLSWVENHKVISSLRLCLCLRHYLALPLYLPLSDSMPLSVPLSL